MMESAMSALPLAREATGACPNARLNAHCIKCSVRKLSVCDALASDEWDALERILHTRCFAKHAHMTREGEASTAVYNITSGVARLYRLLPDGRRQIVGFALPGDFLGLALAEKNAFSADALTEVTACQFDRREFSDLLDEKPHLLRRLHDIAGHELGLAQDQMIILGRRTAEEKVAAFLVGLRDRWARVSGAEVNLPLPMTRQDIADFLGLTIETVSRMFSKFARAKLIVITPDGVRLLDRDGLGKLAEA
jgi:CRP/FNR family transcriptional regulator